MCGTCLPVHQLLNRQFEVSAEGFTKLGLLRTLIGLFPSMFSLSPTSRVVQIHPGPFKSYVDFASKSPRLAHSTFKEIYPQDNVIRLTQRNHGVHEIKMSEVAAWILNATHWFSLLEQPIMIVVP